MKSADNAVLYNFKTRTPPIGNPLVLKLPPSCETTLADQ
jgi:hypothetical protein